jgi:hypothetical protein
MLEHLLTGHPCRRQIVQLPDNEIERLREMLREAANLRISPQQVYDAIGRGFERVYGPLVASPPIAESWAELSQYASALQDVA